MVRYIGTKLIEAIPAQKDGEDGYKVVYPDGYNSWSPADVFERAYLPLSINTRLNTDKPSIGQEMVDDFIAHIEVQTLGDKTTVVRAVLRNGFELVESSSCVSKENYSEELGAQICMKKIKDKVCFLLQTAVHGVKE